MNKTSYLKRFSYASSDTAGQLVFCVISYYLLYFYTDVYGLSVAIAGNILLLARFTDAIDAPVWGVIFDKTHSKWGKSRPWFLWLCVPFAMFGVLTFLTPNFGHTGKVIYAAVTYIVCSVLYTGHQHAGHFHFVGADARPARARDADVAFGCSAPNSACCW